MASVHGDRFLLRRFHDVGTASLQAGMPVLQQEARRWMLDEGTRCCAILRSLFWGLTSSKAVSAPEATRVFCVQRFVGRLCQYNTRKGNNTGLSFAAVKRPTNLTKRKRTQK